LLSVGYKAIISLTAPGNYARIYTERREFNQSWIFYTNKKTVLQKHKGKLKGTHQLFKDSTNEIRKKIEESSEENFRGIFKEILEIHQNAISEAREIIDNADKSFVKEQQANNIFRTIMLNPAVIKAGLTVETPERSILNESYVARQNTTWHDQPQNLVIEMVRIMEVHLNFFVGIASRTKSKVEIREHILELKKEETKKVNRIRRGQTKKGKALNKWEKKRDKSIQAMMKLGISESQAKKAIAEMEQTAKKRENLSTAKKEE
jgi:hypothetical protein